MTVRVLLFDVNETLLDLRPLRSALLDLVGEPDPFDLWFARTLHRSLVLTLTDSYRPFSEIGLDALAGIAAERGAAVPDAELRAALGVLRRIPAHADVRGALTRLRAAGFRTATLTNSPYEVVREQLEHAGIRALFDDVFSVADTRRYKPAPEPYVAAAARLRVEPSQIRMIAAHDWDVAGAARVGCRTAYVARAGPPSPLALPAPEIVGLDLADVADQVLRRDGGS